MSKRRYRVLLPVEIDGQIHHFGEFIELDVETATEYSHALVAVDESGEEVTGGGDQ